MKKAIYLLLAVPLMMASCKKFLKEEATGFYTPDNFFKTPEQIQAAVNGTYTGLDDNFINYIGVAQSPVYHLEYITGYADRVRESSSDDAQFLNLPVTKIPNNVGSLGSIWNSTFYPLENCNNVIDGITKSAALSEVQKKPLLGQVYFLRAYYYFQGVRLFGSIPLKTTPTTSLENLDLDKAPVEDIYNQVVADLIKAADSGLPAEDVSGHVSSNAVHALLAKVYLTMAGYPLQKGAEYYQKALDEANLVINAGVTLYPKYADLRNAANDNKGEQIFMIQREGQFASSILHFQFLPFPEVPISRNTGSGGGMAPNPAFYDSYEPNDLRIQNKQYYYTKAANITTGDTITLPRPYIYKYWDDDAEVTGRNGMNIPLIRFADVLLMAAEAKVMVDGGTSTSDQAAVDAWWQVHHRAFPALTDADKPASITFNDVMKERFWELSFEFQLWYDMLRTRKAFDVATGQMTNLIGYKAPRHTRAFVETDLLLPIPLVEIQKNPKLDK